MKKIILSILILSFVGSGFKCNKSGDPLPPGIHESDIFRGRLYNDHLLRTPAGAIIASKNNIDPAFAPLVDAGFADVFRIAAAPPNNYDLTGINASIYRVWIIKRSSSCQNPAFLVDATGTSYEGSEWDKDPSPNRCLLCAAGMTIMQGVPITGAGMVITDDTGIMRTIVHYEAEHSILWYVDPERYNATQYHDHEHGHPIMGDGPPEFAQSPSLNGYVMVSIKLPESISQDGSIIAAKDGVACILLTK